ncbi:MAG: hypothetical protein J6N52_09520 [Clostridia bacterium]|nr:hypothetical protein [Clostridia bacterium]
MKKRCIVIPVIILPIVIGIFCLINMNNFYLGSNGMFYRTVSDYPNTTWVCEEPKAIIEVTCGQFGEVWGTKSILELEIDGEKNRFSISDRVNIFDLFRLDENGNKISDDRNDPNGNVIRTHAKYKKNVFGEVTSFRIEVLNDNQSIAGYKVLNFYKLSE